MHDQQTNDGGRSGMHSSPHFGLRVEHLTTEPGLLELAPLAEHRLRIHAGPPVRGACSVHRFLYTRGDIDIQPPGYSDKWEEYQRNTSLVVHISPALLRRAAEQIDLDPGRAVLEVQHQFRDSQIEHIAWALDVDRRSAHPNGGLYTESLGLALAVHLLGRYRAARRVAPVSPIRGRGLSAAQFRRLVAFIEEHLDEDLSIARLADSSAISASHFKALFKRTTGMPVHRYVVQRRVERARDLLAAGELSTSQVALATGFAHQSHMARAMRRLLGVAPRGIARGQA
jgi:AraC family transcriptional regulator